LEALLLEPLAVLLGALQPLLNAKKKGSLEAKDERIK
jgi:hypothetical protein